MNIGRALCPAVPDMENKYMSEYVYITLRGKPELKDMAADWFHKKWGVPREAYLECMTAYLDGNTENGWYLCMLGDQIVGGLGVIDNAFHDRKDLSPNVCAVYTEEVHRNQGIAGKLDYSCQSGNRSDIIRILFQYYPDAKAAGLETVW